MFGTAYAIAAPWLLFALTLIAAIVLSRELRSARAAVSAPPGMLRVGGRVVTAADWSPEVLEEVRLKYFRPAASRGYVAVTDLGVSCPRGHSTHERVVVVASERDTVMTVVERLPRARYMLRCKECGKPGRVSFEDLACVNCDAPGKLTSKAVVWEGPFLDWDGAI